MFYPCSECLVRLTRESSECKRLFLTIDLADYTHRPGFLPKLPDRGVPVSKPLARANVTSSTAPIAAAQPTITFHVPCGCRHNPGSGLFGAWVGRAAAKADIDFGMLGCPDPAATRCFLRIAFLCSRCSRSHWRLCSGSL